MTEVRFETLLLVAVRVTIMLAVMPIFSSSQVPLQVRVGLGMVLTIVVAQIVPVLPGTLGLGELTGAIVAQALVGFVFGFIAYLVFTGVQFAGEILDIQIGFAVVNIINPATQQQVTIVGEFELALATLIYLGVDGHHLLLQGMAGSFNVLPLPYATMDPLFGSSIMAFFSQCLFLVFKIAAPISISLFLTNVTLGLMARVAPQMNVFSVGLPLQIAVGLTMLIICMPLLGNALPEVFAETPRQLDAVLRHMVPRAAVPVP